MCKWGDIIPVRVTVIAALSHTGEARVATKGIDRCIAPLVGALQAADIYMRSSCCGHGKGDGEIVLVDGRRLIVQESADV